MKSLGSDSQYYKNYSKENGNMINKSNLNNLKMEKIEDNNCNKCSFENEKGYNYCKNCGNILYIIKEVENEEKLKNKIKLSNSINFINILRGLINKNIIFTSFVSIFILLAISLIIKVFTFINLSPLDSIINPLHIILLFNLVNLHGYSSSIFGSGAINIKLGLLIIIIVPIISLVISNTIFMRKNRKDINELFRNSMGVGISYSLILLFIGLISNVKLNLSDMLNFGVSLNIRYNYLSILFNGFLIGFLTTYFIGFNKSYKKENIYFYLFKKAIDTVLLGYFIIFIIMIILSLYNQNFLFELGIYGYYDNLSIMLSQLSSYIWLFANFIPVTLQDNLISVFNILDSNLFFNTKLILYSTIFISFIMLLISGCIIKHKCKENSTKSVLIFSLFYAIIMSILASFSILNIDGNISLIKINSYESSIYMGSNIFITMILSFIYSYVVSGIGYKLYTNEQLER